MTGITRPIADRRYELNDSEVRALKPTRLPLRPTPRLFFSDYFTKSLYAWTVRSMRPLG
jgi:hypothetical protein